MKTWFQSKLRAKLLLIVLISVTPGLFLAIGALYVKFDAYLHVQEEQHLKNYLQFLSKALDQGLLLEKDRRHLGEFVRSGAILTEARFSILDANGLVLADSETPAAEQGALLSYLERPEIQEATHKAFGRFIRESSADQPRRIYLALALKQDEAIIGYLRASFLEKSAAQFLSGIRASFIFVGIMVVIISVLLVGLLSSRIIRNLDEIVQHAQQIADGNLSTRIEISSRDELRQLAQAMNKMSRRLAVSLAQLNRDREDLNTVLTSIDEGIIAIAHNRKVIFYNQRAWQLLGIDYQSKERLFYYQVLNHKHLISLLDNFFEKNLLISDEIELDTTRTLDVVISPLDIEGKPRKGAVVVLRDISHYKKLARIRKDFVANVSHEFKTPLAAIRASAETLLDWGLTEPELSKKYIRKILKQSRHLESLVADILQLARIERLQNIELHPFAPDPIIRELVQEYLESAREKQLSLETRLTGKGIEVLGEPEMFRSALANLIDNAIKYTPPGGSILISTHFNRDTAVFSVRDTGIGIPAHKIERIFERFYRVDKARDRSTPGTGLGLSIVKHLVELQNGKVWVESKENQGSCFSIRLRLYKSTEEKPSPQ